MRRLFIVGAALGLMWRLPHLAISGQDTAIDPLTLAAIGFVLLAAFAVGEAGGRLKMPRVTGYIVCGILLGPFALNVLSSRVAQEMQVFNTLALGLIATTAGLELDIKAMGKVSRTLISTIALKIPFLLLFVGGTFFVVQTYWPVLPDVDSEVVIALSLIFSILAIGTSPAIAIAVVSESKAKGRLSDLVLAIAVTKDLVVVVCLALVISYVRARLSPEGSLDMGALFHLGQELGLSLAAGALIGTVMILYAKFIRAEQLMCLIVIVAIAAEVSRVFHLELLLMLIAAGFVVRNFSKQEHHLVESLTRVSLPVFVVFFTTAGANVDLLATATLLPLAGAVVLARAVAYAIAARLGGLVGGESEAVRANAWMAYLPQAGVTLGLILIAAEALPELAVPIRQTGMAVVALNLLFGPVLMSLALRRAKEVPKEDGVEAPDALPALSAEIDQEMAIVPDASPAAGLPSSTPAFRARADLRADTLTRRAGSEDLARIAADLGHTLVSDLSAFMAHTATPLCENGRLTVGRLLKSSDRTDILTDIGVLLAKTPPKTPSSWERDVEALLLRQLAAVRSTPRLMNAMMTRELLQKKRGDALYLRFRKTVMRLLSTLGFKMARVREVPISLIASICIEPRLAKAAASAAASWHRAFINALAQVGQAVDGHRPPEEIRESIGRIFSVWRIEVEADLLSAVDMGILETCDHLAMAGSPTLPRRHLSYAKAVPVIEIATGEIAVTSEPWRAVVLAAYQTLRVTALVRSAEERFIEVLQRRIGDPLVQIEERLLPVVITAVARIERLRDMAASETTWDSDALTRFLGEAHALFPSEGRKFVRDLTAAFRSTTRKSQLTGEVTAVLAGFPAMAATLPMGIRPESIGDPSEVHLAAVNYAQRMERAVSEHYLKPMAQMTAQIGSQIVAAEPSIREAVHLVTYGLEVAMHRTGDDATVKRELVLGALERALQRATQAHGGIVDDIAAVQRGVATLLSSLPQQLQEILFRKPSSGELIRASAAAIARTSWMRRFSAIAQLLKEQGHRFYQYVSGASKRSMEEWQIQSGAVRLDAMGIADYCGHRLPALPQMDLPRVYKESLSLQPLVDRRMLSARRPLIENVLSTVSDRGDYANPLIVGPRGSGKTTLMTELHFRLPERRVLRLEGWTIKRGADIVASLADELGCATDPQIVTAQLNRDKSIVLFDDLERVLSPTPEGISVIDSWLKLVVGTTGNAKWVVTINTETLTSLLDLGLPFKKAFGRIVALPPLEWREIRQAISARQRLAGISVRMGRQLGPLDFLFNWRRGSRETQHYRSLESVSGGNLRAALLAHLLSLSVDGEGLVAAQPRRFAMPFLPLLPAEALALLGQLIRLGPISLPNLGPSLGISEEEMDATMLFLEQAGLVERKMVDYEEALEVPVHLVDAMQAALVRMRVIPEGSP